MAKPSRWTDDDVRDYLVTTVAPLERCRVSEALYGYVDDDGVLYVAMDDDDDRVWRIVRYLKKIGAAELKVTGNRTPACPE